jgi:hypothetical protein
MNEADQALQKALGVDNQDESIHGANKALLFLAIGRNAEAYETLQRNRAAKEADRIAAYSAVALARMGRKDQANAALAASEAAHPNSGVLKAAREHLNLGTPGISGFSASPPTTQSRRYKTRCSGPGNLTLAGKHASSAAKRWKHTSPRRFALQLPA